MDTALTQAGDWIRFTGYNWLIWTNFSASDITKLARSVLKHPEDSVLVIAVDPRDYSGWAAPWVWQWIDSKTNPAIGLNPLQNKLLP